MTDVMMQFPEVVSDARGTFHARAMARDRADGGWEGWLEFVPEDHTSLAYSTPIETHQHDRVTMERWASGLTHVYAEGALARARIQQPPTRESELMSALQEIVDALDRRIPHVTQAGEAAIAADAARLRADAVQRIAILRDRSTDPS
jgi:hypothetical protein